MATLTIQYKHIKHRWEDRTVVVVRNLAILETKIAALIAEIPKNTVARVKVDIDGTITYRS